MPTLDRQGRFAVAPCPHDLAERVLHRVRAWSPRERRLPADLARADSGRFTLRASAHDLAGLAELRRVCITGTASAVLSTLIVPNDPSRIPLFVCDLVIAGDQVRMLFVDWQDVGLTAEVREHARNRVHPVGRRWGDPAAAQELPAWAIAHSLGSPIYLRGEAARQVAIEAILIDAVNAWGNAWNPVEFAAGIMPTIFSCLDDFRATHSRETPVRAYLERIFGSAWADRFVTDFLFSRARMSVLSRMQAVLREPHDRIEALPLPRAIATSQVDRAVYVRLLGQLEHVHTALEALSPKVPHLGTLHRPDMDRSADARRDREWLGETGAVAPLPETQRLIAAMTGWLTDRPTALLGSVYVLEGSRMGSMFLARALAKAFGSEARAGQGLDYHLAGVEQRPALWQAFKAAFDALPLTEAEQDAAVQGGIDTFAGLYAIYAALGESQPNPGVPA